MGFPGGTSGTEHTWECRRLRDPGSAPGWGRPPGGGNGSPLQCSCLENPMDRAAWRATVHGVAKSQTRLKRHQTPENDRHVDYRHRSQPRQAATGQMWDNLNIKIKTARKESGKEYVSIYIYIYIYTPLNQFAEHLKLTHCQSILLQHKI